MKKNATPIEALLVVGLLIAGYLLGKFQTNYRLKGALDPVSNIIQKLVLPPDSAISGFENWGSNFVSGMGHAAQLQAANVRLKNQVASLAPYQQQIDLLQGQIDNLKLLQGFQIDAKTSKVPCEIIATFAYENRITLNVGSSRGIKPNMPVISGFGLLAIVQTVTSQTCQAELITSPTSTFGAISLRNPPAAGLLHGEDASTLIVDFLDPKAPIQVGDNLVTSGFSEFIPRGIRIGRVFRVEDNADFGTRRALVYPWASLGSARDLMVIK